uniref:Ovule protein n=1 Tax=Steinernema glaseri TaxID=37863 RepID=A0A1I8AG01_9BILA
MIVEAWTLKERSKSFMICVTTEGTKEFNHSDKKDFGQMNRPPTGHAQATHFISPTQPQNTNPPQFFTLNLLIGRLLHLARSPDIPKFPLILFFSRSLNVTTITGIRNKE